MLSRTLQSRRSLIAELAFAAALTAGCAGETADPSQTLPSESSDLKGRRAPTLTPQQSGTTSRLQAISPVSARVVWASGVNGTYALTTDGGRPGRWPSPMLGSAGSSAPRGGS